MKNKLLLFTTIACTGAMILTGCSNEKGSTEAHHNHSDSTSINNDSKGGDLIQKGLELALKEAKNGETFNDDIKNAEEKEEFKEVRSLLNSKLVGETFSASILNSTAKEGNKNTSWRYEAANGQDVYDVVSTSNGNEASEFQIKVIKNDEGTTYNLKDGKKYYVENSKKEKLEEKTIENKATLRSLKNDLIDLPYLQRTKEFAGIASMLVNGSYKITTGESSDKSGKAYALYSIQKNGEGQLEALVAAYEKGSNKLSGMYVYSLNENYEQETMKSFIIRSIK